MDETHFSWANLCPQTAFRVVMKSNTYDAVLNGDGGHMKKKFPTLAALTLAMFLAACGGGEEDTNQPQNPPVVKPPESGVCSTTVPIPPDCSIIHK